MIYFSFLNPYIIYAFFVLLTSSSIYLVFTRKEWLRLHKSNIYLVVSGLLIWTQVARYGVVYLKGNFTVEESLPFFICRLSVLVLLYYTVTKDKRVESFLFYWGATGLAGILYPNGPISNIANLTETFYIDHFLLSITPFFLLTVEEYKPIKQDLYIITGVLFLILLVFVPINMVLNADYFYLQDQSIFALIVPNAPQIVFIIAHTIGAYALFGVYYNKFKNYHV